MIILDHNKTYFTKYKNQGIIPEVFPLHILKTDDVCFK